MKGLDALGITEIGLGASANTGAEIEGNPVLGEATFTINGEARTIADVTDANAYWRRLAA